MPLSPETKMNLTDQNTWLRLLFMLLFVFIYSIVEIVIAGVVILQFLSHLIWGMDNPLLRVVGDYLGKFVYQMILFLTYNTEKKPFPFGNWPGKRGRGRRRRRTVAQRK